MAYNFGNYYMPPYQQNQYYQQPIQPQYQQPIQQDISNQPVKLPLVLVNNVDEVRGYIMQLNQAVYLKTPDNTIYEKISDNTGNIKYNVYSRISNEENNKETQNTQYATKEDLKALENVFLNTINNLSINIEKAFKKENEVSE